MPAYKKQHYLPAAYLKYFSIDQHDCSRKSRILRFDGAIQHEVTVESQCSEDYHFSRTRAEVTERMFQSIENRYCICVDKIKSGATPSGLEFGDLLLASFEFHLRNAFHKNLTGKEGIDAYNLRSRVFMTKMLLGRETPSAAKEEIVTLLQENWGLRVLSGIPGHVFLTSDNPAAWLCLNTERPTFDLALLPLTPDHLAVAYDKRSLRVVDTPITPEDERTLNAAQIDNSVRCVYASGKIPDELVAIIRHHFSQRSKPDGAVYPDGWKLRLLSVYKEHRFSFIRPTPPLL